MNDAFDNARTDIEMWRRFRWEIENAECSRCGEAGRKEDMRQINIERDVNACEYVCSRDCEEGS